MSTEAVISRYFHDVHAECGTDFWVNNASLPEIELSLAAGAVGVVSNPAYIANLMKAEPEFVRATIDEVVAEAAAAADERLAVRVFEKAVGRPLRMCTGLYRETDGRQGHVAIQGNPRRNDDLDAMLVEAERFHGLGENIIIKMPATVVGARALEDLTARGWPTIGTMCFSVPQYIHMAEAHRRGARRAGTTPKCLITMLPGMFGEYLAEDAARRGVEISPEALHQAGITTAREAYKVYRERQYDAGVLSAGSRSMSHFTELVGPGVGITLSGKLAQELIAANPPLAPRIDASSPPEVIAEVREKFPDFVRACDADAMDPAEFRSYGPVVRFQNALLEGFATVVEEIQSRRVKKV